jgi:hypothetical protein
LGVLLSRLAAGWLQRWVLRFQEVETLRSNERRFEEQKEDWLRHQEYSALVGTGLSGNAPKWERALLGAGPSGNRLKWEQALLGA